MVLLILLIAVEYFNVDSDPSKCPWTSHDSSSHCSAYDVLNGTLEDCQGSCDQEEWCKSVSYKQQTQQCNRHPATMESFIPDCVEV